MPVLPAQTAIFTIDGVGMVILRSWGILGLPLGILLACVRHHLDLHAISQHPIENQIVWVYNDFPVARFSIAGFVQKRMF